MAVPFTQYYLLMGTKNLITARPAHKLCFVGKRQDLSLSKSNIHSTVLTSESKLPRKNSKICNFSFTGWLPRPTTLMLVSVEGSCRIS
jgi:hypothetical protein